MKTMDELFDGSDPDLLPEPSKEEAMWRAEYDNDAGHWIVTNGKRIARCISDEADANWLRDVWNRRAQVEPATCKDYLQVDPEPAPAVTEEMVEVACRAFFTAAGDESFERDDSEESIFAMRCMRAALQAARGGDNNDPH